MEFERQVFRVHERVLSVKGASTCLLITQCIFLILTLFFAYNLQQMHSLFVNKNEYLKG